MGLCCLAKIRRQVLAGMAVLHALSLSLSLMLAAFQSLDNRMIAPTAETSECLALPDAQNHENNS